MSLSFYEDFPTKYLCAARRLSSSYEVVFEGTDGVWRNKVYNIIPPETDPLHRMSVNPLFGLVEGKKVGKSLNSDVAYIFGVSERIILLFSNGVRGFQYNNSLLSDQEAIAFNLGYFFRIFLFKKYDRTVSVEYVKKHFNLGSILNEFNLIYNGN